MQWLWVWRKCRCIIIMIISIWIMKVWSFDLGVKREEPGSGSKEGVFANGGEGARDIGGDDAALQSITHLRVYLLLMERESIYCPSRISLFSFCIAFKYSIFMTLFFIIILDNNVKLMHNHGKNVFFFFLGD